MHSFLKYTKVFLYLILSLWLVNVSHATENEAEAEELFYENASFVNLEKQLALIVESSADNPIIQKYSLIFLTVALDKHKDYIPEFISKYRSYSKPMKSIIAQALAEVGDADILLKLKENKIAAPTHSTIKSVNELSFINKDFDNYNEEDERYNCIVADSLILAFHASGDEKYLIKIMKFLSDWSVPVKQLAWEMLTKDMQPAKVSEKEKAAEYQNIINAVEKTKLANKFQLLTYKIILWAVESNRDQHKDARDKIERIKQANPELDYSRDIKL